MLSAAKFSALTLSFVSSAYAIGTAVGFGKSTTGGGSATAQVPSSNAELATWLSDSTARVIQLNSIYDFTSTYGTSSVSVCSPWTCTPNPQSIVATLGACDSYTTRTVTMNNAGYSTNLKVGSNKTLLGKGSSAGIKGIGLKIQDGVSNIIIQNIKITDINHQYVWGGDGILISNATNVWIDHNYFNRVGRQFLTTGFGNAKGVTISNNYFDGTATWSTGCDNHHYWGIILAGQGDTVTFVNNWLYYTAGRSPHTGGQASTDTLLYHFVNNYISSNTGHALDIGQGTRMLAEGNYFASVKTPIAGVDTNGHLYFPTTVNDAYGCSNANMGRYCEWNRIDSSSGTPGTYLDTSVFSTILATDSSVKGLTPKGVADVPAYVQANAGVGKVN
ncbi:pectin lyase-like protein [Flagelloscypha sp. PMI_526]|nr:pectin lyase-like protein [Flagelloscypha sp. PMI_526]